ncbi:hypothetical protein TNCV_1036781 [Trichonephila clavipes]|nr:hypothetical protein TNCV_1036781 [Trichonephila clavipes]
MRCFGRQVAGRNYPPTNKNTLIRALTEEWDKLPQQLLDNVVQIKKSALSLSHDKNDSSFSVDSSECESLVHVSSLSPAKVEKSKFLYGWWVE